MINNIKTVKKILTSIITIATLMAASLSSTTMYAQEEPAPGEGARLLAHRGGRAEIDENTLEAFQHAFDSGCWALETDVRFTKDKELIILHDGNFKRMCGIDRAPEEMTAAEIRDLRTKEGHKIPFLKDLVNLLKKYDGERNYIEYTYFDGRPSSSKDGNSKTSTFYLVWNSPGTPTEVKEIDDDLGGLTVVSERYYDISGIEHDGPFNGMNIIVKQMSDGSTQTEKVMR